MDDAIDRRRLVVAGGMLAGLGLVSAGCAQAQPQPDEDGQPDLSFLVGKTLRVANIGDAITMDYREDRLTIIVDDNNRITQISVG